ncbi:MAG: tripartite tricarboxylate transporter substrate binding protein [Betaproteobacteria bacterium]|nr:tripartite tricarboxylate transporter substrate binding protein [Betaproteobacteria bacterium]
MKAAITGMTAALIGFGIPAISTAQGTYPARQITMVVPFSAGSQPDILARALADGIAKQTSQPLVVVNRDGASGTIAVASVAQARPDGYTIGFGPQGQFSIQPHLRKDLTYKLEGFDFLCQTNGGAFVVVSGPETPYKTLAELIAAARNAPGKLSFGSAGHATGPHLIGESIALEAGIKLNHVPFRNVGDMYAQTINGTIDFVVTTPIVLTLGRGLRALAVVGDGRLPKNPDVPTLAELGYKRSTLPGFTGIYVPRGVPQDAATWLRKACAQAVDTPVFKAASEKTVTPLVYADAPVYAAGVAKDYRDMGELLNTLGIKAQ